MRTASPSTILLTGASGFVGDAILSALVEAGHRVIALSRSRPPRTHVGVDPVSFDLAADNLSGRIAALPPFHAAIHAAGTPKFLVKETGAMRRLHVESTVALSRECAMRGARFVHISTAFACPAPDGHLEEGLPGSRQPSNAYEKTKTEAERLLAADERPGVDIVRPAIVVPEPDADIEALRSSPLGAFMAVACAAEGCGTLPGSARARLAFTRRRDLAAIVCRILESPAPERTRWWNLCAAPPPRLGDIPDALRSMAAHADFRFAGNSARRLRAWAPYLADDRSWSMEATRAGLASIDAPLVAVTANDIARCCARLVELAWPRLCA